MVQPEQSASLLTAEQAYRLDPDGRWELVEGRLVDVSPVRPRHGKLLGRLTARLVPFVEQHDLGEVYTGDVGFVLKRNPDTVRGPDLAFVRKERVPAVDAAETFPDVAPDLVVEVLSPSDRWPAVERKVAEYQGAGVPLVWAIDDSSRTARAYRPGRPVGMLSEGDALEAPDLLPGFRLVLQDLFTKR